MKGFVGLLPYFGAVCVLLVIVIVTPDDNRWVIRGSLVFLGLAASIYYRRRSKYDVDPLRDAKAVAALKAPPTTATVEERSPVEQTTLPAAAIPNVKLTQAQGDERDRLLRDAVKLAKPYLWRSEPPDIEARTKLGEALELFKRVLAIDPSNWRAMAFVGLMYRGLWNHEVALEWFQEAARLNPSSVDVAQDASLSAQYAGKTEEGVRFARKALELRPGDIELHNNLAIALLLANRLTDSRVEAAITLARAPLDPLAHQIEDVVYYFIEHDATPPATRMAFDDFLDHRPF